MKSVKIYRFIVGILVFILATAAMAQDLKPVTIKLPKPKFIGTPQNLKVPNLEKPLGRPREPFLAPAGTINVALNKPVTSS
ncbi:MAG TPA: hypothetical protein PLG50_11145, partial [bacterium]|nr:hypothetical protein [bacterium]